MFEIYEISNLRKPGSKFTYLSLTTIGPVPNATIEFAIVRQKGYQIWFFLKNLKVENSAMH